MSLMPKSLVTIALAGLLAGCADAPTVYSTRIYHSEWPIFFSGASQSEYLAVVWGNPFETAQERTDAVVLKSVDQAFNRANNSFSTNPASVDPLVPYVAVLFNPRSLSSGLPCSDLTQLQPTGVTSGEVYVHAALCRGASPLTTARGRVAGVSGPDDPRFEALMYQISVELFRHQRGTQPDRNERT